MNERQNFNGIFNSNFYSGEILKLRQANELENGGSEQIF